MSCYLLEIISWNFYSIAIFSLKYRNELYRKWILEELQRYWKKFSGGIINNLHFQSLEIVVAENEKRSIFLLQNLNKIFMTQKISVRKWFF